MVTYIFSHDPKGPEELSFRLKRKCSIPHYLDPWRQTEGKALSDSAKFLLLSKHHILSHFSKLKTFYSDVGV